MQLPERSQEQTTELAGTAERLATANAFRKMTGERKGAAEREHTKFRALHEVFGLCETSLMQHRAQTAEAPGTSPFVLEGLDAAIDELRRLQKQTLDFSLKHEGAVNALSSLEDTFKQVEAQLTAHLRQLPKTVSATEKSAPQAATVPEPPSEGMDDLLSALGDPEDSAKEPIGEPRRGTSRKSK